MVRYSEVPVSEQGVSVVVPVYNSEQSLPELVSRLAKVLPGLASAYEVILVNDGSSDRSWDVVREHALNHRWIVGINLLRNYGQHNALLCGIRAARYDVTVTMDDDLQHSPEELPKMIGKLAEGYDVVYGAPLSEQHGLWRDLASKATKLAMQRAIGARNASNVSAFRAFRTRLRGAFECYRGAIVCIDVLLTWGTDRFGVVRVRHDPRKMGRSQYTVRKLVRHAMNMLTGFSILPLQFASVLGFSLTVFGVGVFIYVLVRYFVHGATVPGFAFLASIISIFSGAQLFSLGIIGEYLGRMHFRIIDKPTYVIAESVQNKLFEH